MPARDRLFRIPNSNLKNCSFISRFLKIRGRFKIVIVIYFSCYTDRQVCLEEFEKRTRAVQTYMIEIVLITVIIKEDLSNYCDVTFGIKSTTIM